MSAAITMCGFGGLAYSAIAIRRAHHQTDYKPDWEDWLWYALLPCSVYVILIMAGLLQRAINLAAMFLIAVAAFGLLLIGIHNAWDTVTHIVVVRLPGDAKTRSSKEGLIEIEGVER